MQPSDRGGAEVHIGSGAQVPATALPLPASHPPGTTQLPQLREAYGGLALLSKPHGKMEGTGTREEGVTEVERKGPSVSGPCPLFELRVAGPAEP